MSTLYIIGNGFDLQHGLQSRYKDFKNYLYENYDVGIEGLETTYTAIKLNVDNFENDMKYITFCLACNEDLSIMSLQDCQNIISELISHNDEERIENVKICVDAIIYDSNFDIPSSIKKIDDMVNVILNQDADQNTQQLVNEYLEKKYNNFPDEIKSEVEDFFFWSYFENAVGYVNPYIMDHVFQVDGNISKSEDQYDVELKYEEFIKQIGAIRYYFQEWVVSFMQHESIKIIKFDLNAIYLTFNYSNALEKYYNIEKKFITYIHGSVLNDDRLHLGHTRSSAEIEREILSRVEHHDDGYQRFQKGSLKENKNIYELFRKDTQACIKKHKDFFSEENLAAITKIVILGHSLGDEDKIYFEEIMKYAKKPNLIIEYAYYSERAKGKAEKFIRTLDIKEINIRLHTWDYYKL